MKDGREPLYRSHQGRPKMALSAQPHCRPKLLSIQGEAAAVRVGELKENGLIGRHYCA